MPKLKLSPQAQKTEQFRRRVRSQRELLGMATPKDALAHRIGMPYSTYINKVNRGMDFSYLELQRIFETLKFTPEMIVEVL